MNHKPKKFRPQFFMLSQEHVSYGREETHCYEGHKDLWGCKHLLQKEQTVGLKG